MSLGLAELLELVQLGASADGCEIHDDHEPLPGYTERHHVVPRAWQTFWAPPGDHPYRAGAVWDSRTVLLCRTGHGNVHVWIVAYMTAAEQVGARNSLGAIFEAGHRLHGHVGGNENERRAAQLALQRWKEVGGSIADLLAHGLYGGI